MFFILTPQLSSQTRKIWLDLAQFFTKIKCVPMKIFNFSGRVICDEKIRNHRTGSLTGLFAFTPWRGINNEFSFILLLTTHRWKPTCLQHSFSQLSFIYKHTTEAPTHRLCNNTWDFCYNFSVCESDKHLREPRIKCKCNCLLEERFIVSIAHRETFICVIKTSSSYNKAERREKKRWKCLFIGKWLNLILLSSIGRATGARCFVSIHQKEQ